VAGYKDFVKERFERCLDLYLCPRAIKKNVDVDPDRYAHT
jgi:ribosome biogenesis protein ERB1